MVSVVIDVAIECPYKETVIMKNDISWLWSDNDMRQK